MDIQKIKQNIKITAFVLAAAYALSACGTQPVSTPQDEYVPFHVGCTAESPEMLNNSYGVVFSGATGLGSRHLFEYFKEVLPGMEYDQFLNMVYNYNRSECGGKPSYGVSFFLNNLSDSQFTVNSPTVFDDASQNNRAVYFPGSVKVPSKINELVEQGLARIVSDN